MKKNQKKQNKFQRKYYFLIVILSVLLLVYLFSLNSEKLISNHPVLQMKNELIDAKSIASIKGYNWKYSEGCIGKGGVYNRDEPSYCSVTLSLTNNSNSSLSTILSTYIEIFHNKTSFIFDSTPTTSQAPNRQNVISYISTKLNINSIKNEHCELTISRRDGTDEVSSSLNCSLPSNKFYFDRNDK